MNEYDCGSFQQVQIISYITLNISEALDTARTLVGEFVKLLPTKSRKVNNISCKMNEYKCGRF